MDKEKKLHMIKSFHVAPDVVKDFEALRLQMCARLGYRIGSADFFAWLVRQAKQSQEAPGTFKNFSE